MKPRFFIGKLAEWTGLFGEQERKDLYFFAYK